MKFTIPQGFLLTVLLLNTGLSGAQKLESFQLPGPEKNSL
jgi:hypothetical protein